MITIELAPRRFHKRYDAENHSVKAVKDRFSRTVAVGSTIVEFARHTADSYRHAKIRTHAAVAVTVMTPILASCSPGSSPQEASTPTQKIEHSLIVPTSSKSDTIKPTSHPSPRTEKPSTRRVHPNATPTEYITTPDGGLISYTPFTPNQVLSNPEIFHVTPSDQFVGLTVPAGTLEIDPNEVTGVKIQTETLQGTVDQGDFGLINLGNTVTVSKTAPNNVESIPTYILAYFPRTTTANINLITAANSDEKQVLVGTLEPMVNEKIWKTTFSHLDTYGRIDLINNTLVVSASTLES